MSLKCTRFVYTPDKYHIVLKRCEHLFKVSQTKFRPPKVVCTSSKQWRSIAHKQLYFTCILWTLHFNKTYNSFIHTRAVAVILYWPHVAHYTDVLVSYCPLIILPSSKRYSVYWAKYIVQLRLRYYTMLMINTYLVLLMGSFVSELQYIT